MNSHYTQYRLARRKGELVLQTRKVTAIYTHLGSILKFWKLSQYDVDYTYTNWEDMPNGIPEIE